MELMWQGEMVSWGRLVIRLLPAKNLDRVYSTGRNSMWTGSHK